MKTMATKISALLVALCMVISIIPAQFAEAAEEDVELIFNSTAAGTSTITDVSVSSNAGWALNATETTAPINNANLQGHRLIWDADKVGNKIVFNFKVETAGFYAPSLLLNADVEDYSGDFKVSVDDVIIGDIISEQGKRENMTVAFDTVYLTADTHSLTLEVTKNYAETRGYIYATSFTFAWTDPVQMPVNLMFNSTAAGTSTITDVSVSSDAGWALNTVKTTAPINNANLLTNRILWDADKVGNKIVFDFNVKAAGYYSASMLLNADVLEHSGDFKVSVDDVIIGDIISEQGNRTNMTVAFDAVYLTATNHTLALEVTKNYKETRGYIYLTSFTLNPATVSAVSLAEDTITVAAGNSATTAITYKTSENENVANALKVTCEPSGVATAEVVDGALKVTGIAQGTANVTVEDVTGLSDTVAVTIEAAPAPAVTNFGTTYAYIRQNYNAEQSGSYTLVLVSAIDSLDYDNVGFSYKIGNGEYANTGAIKKVYKTLSLNGSSDDAYILTPDELGADAENGYLFYTEITITAEQAASAVAFNAYANIGNTEVTGNTATIDTAVANAQ